MQTPPAAPARLLLTRHAPTPWNREYRYDSRTDIDVDHRGRVWVCEVINYRRFANGDKPERTEGDRILILEDTDADGVQLEQLAREVLVGVVLSGVRPGQEDHHRRVGDRLGQQLVEAAQCILADQLAVGGTPGEL